MSARMVFAGFLSFALLLGACGGEQGPQPGPTDPTPTWKNSAPSLHVASPGQMRVGDTLQVLGSGFIDRQHGYPIIVLKGTYFDSQGGQQTVDLQHKAKRVNKGKVTWRMWPNIVFDATGDHLGYFLGTVAVINVGSDGTQEASENLPLRIDVQPSLIPRMARPGNSACQSVVSATLEDTSMAFTVEAVGLRPATTDAPLTFYWTFMAEHWELKTSYGTMDPGTVLPKTGALQLEDTVTKGRASSIAGGSDRSLLFKVGSDLLGSSGLKTLKTRKVPSSGDSFTATVNVAAVDASGKSVKLSIPLDVFRVASMHYSGGSKIAERFPPVQVSDCIPGGDIGRQVSYSEDKAESRSRSMSFQFNAGIGANFAPIPSNPFALGINFNVGFGVDTSASVSSSKSQGLNLSGQVLPGEFGVFYRQTTKVYRVAKLTAHNQCGQTADLGEVILTDWLFTPELATGSTCVPPSQLPAAGKFL